jgi:hypothetical protein
MNKLLNSCKIGVTDTNFTHVSKTPPRKYYVSNSITEEFWDMYCNSKPQLLEKPYGYSMLRFDFDHASENPNDLLNIEQLAFRSVYTIQECLKNLLVNPKPQTTDCLLLTKDQYFSEEKQKYKHGYHLQFPNLFLSSEDQRRLCSILEKDIQGLDKIYNHPWLLYGSKKNQESGYYKADTIICSESIHMEPEDYFENYKIYNNKRKEVKFTKPIEYYYPRILSIFPFGRDDLVYDLKPEVNPVSNKTPTKEKIYDDISTDETLLVAKRLVPMLADFRSTDRNEWIKIGWILFSISDGHPESLELWCEFSSRDENTYDEQCCIDLWDKMTKRDLTLGSLHFYAKTDNPAEYSRFCSEHFNKEDEFKVADEINVSIDKMFIIQPSEFIKIQIIPENIEFALPIVFPPDIRSIAIHQYLGGGKTTSIIAYINSMPADSIIVLLSPRISFADSITNEYNTNLNPEQTKFICYTSLKSKKTMSQYRRLVVSMESLHYILNSNSFIPDLLVIDECQANLVQHTCIDTNGNNIVNNIAVFEILCKQSKQIIWADAFLGSKTTNLINNFQIPTVIYQYTHKMNPRDLIVVPSLDKKVMLAKNLTPLDSMLIYIIDALNKGERNYIFVSSKQKLIFWAKIISDTFPDKRILSYVGGSKIGNIKTDWAKADCVLTTSTITVGINFDLKNYFHNIFIYASAFSQNRVSDIIQSHFRVRNIINNQLFLFISTKKNKKLNTNYDSLYKDFDWKESYFKAKHCAFDNAPLAFKQLVIDNIYEQNISTMYLDSMINYYLKKCNYTIKTDNDININDVEFDLDIQEEVPTPFDEIKLINEFEAMELIKKRQQNNQLTNQEKIELDKKLFVSCFCKNNIAWANKEHVAFFWSKWINFGRTKIRMIRKEKQLIEEHTTIGKLYEKQCDDVSIAGIQKNRLLKIEWIRNICNDLGLKHSQDTKTIIPNELVKKIHNRMIVEEKNIRNCFELRDRREDNNSDISFTDSVKLLNSIFNSFGYSKFVKEKKKRQRIDGKQVDVSDFHLQTSDKDFVKEGIDCDTIYDYIDLMEKEQKRLLK